MRKTRQGPGGASQTLTDAGYDVPEGLKRAAGARIEVRSDADDLALAALVDDDAAWRASEWAGAFATVAELDVDPRMVVDRRVRGAFVREGLTRPLFVPMLRTIHKARHPALSRGWARDEPARTGDPVADGIVSAATTGISEEPEGQALIRLLSELGADPARVDLVPILGRLTGVVGILSAIGWSTAESSPLDVDEVMRAFELVGAVPELPGPLARHRVAMRGGVLLEGDDEPDAVAWYAEVLGAPLGAAVLRESGAAPELVRALAAWPGGPIGEGDRTAVTANVLASLASDGEAHRPHTARLEASWEGGGAADRNDVRKVLGAPATGMAHLREVVWGDWRGALAVPAPWRPRRLVTHFTHGQVAFERERFDALAPEALARSREPVDVAVTRIERRAEHPRGVAEDEFTWNAIPGAFEAATGSAPPAWDASDEEVAAFALRLARVPAAWAMRNAVERILAHPLVGAGRAEWSPLGSDATESETTGFSALAAERRRSGRWPFGTSVETATLQALGAFNEASLAVVRNESPSVASVTKVMDNPPIEISMADSNRLLADAERLEALSGFRWRKVDDVADARTLFAQGLARPMFVRAAASVLGEETASFARRVFSLVSAALCKVARAERHEPDAGKINRVDPHALGWVQVIAAAGRANGLPERLAPRPEPWHGIEAWAQAGMRRIEACSPRYSPTTATKLCTGAWPGAGDGPHASAPGGASALAAVRTAVWFADAERLSPRPAAIPGYDDVEELRRWRLVVGPAASAEAVAELSTLIPRDAMRRDGDLLNALTGLVAPEGDDDLDWEVLWREALRRPLLTTFATVVAEGVEPLTDGWRHAIGVRLRALLGPTRDDGGPRDPRQWELMRAAHMLSEFEEEGWPHAKAMRNALARLPIDMEQMRLAKIVAPTSRRAIPLLDALVERRVELPEGVGEAEIARALAADVGDMESTAGIALWGVRCRLADRMGDEVMSWEPAAVVAEAMRRHVLTSPDSRHVIHALVGREEVLRGGEVDDAQLRVVMAMAASSEEIEEDRGVFDDGLIAYADRRPCVWGRELAGLAKMREASMTAFGIMDGGEDDAARGDERAEARSPAEDEGSGSVGDGGTGMGGVAGATRIEDAGTNDAVARSLDGAVRAVEAAIAAWRATGDASLMVDPAAMLGAAATEAAAVRPVSVSEAFAAVDVDPVATAGTIEGGVRYATRVVHVGQGDGPGATLPGTLRDLAADGSRVVPRAIAEAALGEAVPLMRQATDGLASVSSRYRAAMALPDDDAMAREAEEVRASGDVERAYAALDGAADALAPLVEAVRDPAVAMATDVDATPAAEVGASAVVPDVAGEEVESREPDASDPVVADAVAIDQAEDDTVTDVAGGVPEVTDGNDQASGGAMAVADATVVDDVVGIATTLLARDEVELAALAARAAEDAGETPPVPVAVLDLLVLARAMHATEATNATNALAMAVSAIAVDPATWTDDATRDARAAAIAAGLLVPALLGCNADAAARLAESTVRNGVGDAVRAIGEVARTLAHRGVALRAGETAEVGDAAAVEAAVGETRTAALAEVDKFRPGNFTFGFQTHTEVVRGINEPDGFMTRLRTALTGRDRAAAVAAARATTERLGRRNGALDLVDEWTDAYSTTGLRIRNPIVKSWEQRLRALRDALDAHVEACAAATAASLEATRPPRAMEAIRAVPGLLGDLAARAEASDGVGARSLARVARSVAGYLASAADDGRRHDVAVAARHVATLSTTTLSFARAMTPEERGPALVAALAEVARDPALRLGGEPHERVLPLAEAGRTTAAHRLAALTLGGRTDRTGHDAALEAATAAAEAALADAVGMAMRRLEQTERLVEGEAQERIAEVGDRLRALAAGLPLARPSDVGPLPETVPGLDARTIGDGVARVRADLDALIAGPRAAAIARIDALPPGEAADRLSGLVERGDLVTAADLLDLVEGGGRLPRGDAANESFRTFFEVHLPAVEAGTVKVPGAWSDAFAGGGSTRGVEDALGAAGVEIEGHATATGEGTFLVRPRLPASRARGLLLPEFGTMAENAGGLRVTMAARLPGDDAIERAARGGAAAILVRGVVDREARRRLATLTRTRGLTVLVIDAGVASFVAATPTASPLLALETAQPFAYADPHRDYGGIVPGEMFVGREREIASVTDANGSTMVFGGRRLGKSALLHEAEKRLAEARREGAAVETCYVDIRPLGESERTSAIWARMAEGLRAVFAGHGRVTRRKAFVEVVTAWLAEDPARRIVAMLDEADRFVARDAEDGHAETVALVQLMGVTGRRFKVVLSGNVDVTRAVSQGNSPLRPFTEDAILVGPLVGVGDRAAAERLVTRPLAALGYEFASRDLVWSILSQAIWYPTLINVLTRGILAHMRAKARGDAPMPVVIDREDVERVLADRAVRLQVAERFNYTLKLDVRYGFVANLVATQPRGMAGALTAHAIAAQAQALWSAAFPPESALWRVQDLQNELDRLGVLRRTADGGYDLRSDVIRELLGSREQMEATLLQIAEGTPPAAPGESDIRRRLRPDPASPATAGSPPSPFTIAQERDVAETGSPIVVVTGNGPLGIDLAVAGVLQNPRLDRRGHQVEVMAFAKREGLISRLGQVGKERGSRTIVVPPSSPWDGSWVRTAMDYADVRDRRVRLVFVAGAAASRRVCADPYLDHASVDVLPVRLGTMTAAMVADRADELEAMPDEASLAALRAATGHYPRLVDDALRAMVGKPDKALAVAAWAADPASRRGILAELGVDVPVAALLGTVSTWQGAEGLTVTDLAELQEGRDFVRDVEPLLAFCEAMGLLAREGEGEGRRFRVNPLYAALVPKGA